MSRPPKYLGYQISYPYMVMPMDMKDYNQTKHTKKIERTKVREVH
jgi:hypothetical protein